MKNAIRYVILPFIMAGIFACHKQEAELAKLVLETNAITTMTGCTDTVLISGGSGEVEAASENPEVAAASILKVGETNAVLIEALAAGSAIVTVSDVKTGEEAMFTVTVQNGLSLSSYEAVMEEGNTVSIDILSGNGDYNVEVGDAGLVSALVEGEILNISGLSEGETVVSLIDNISGEKAEIAVTVEKVPVINFTSTCRFGTIKINVRAPEEFQGKVWIDLNADGIRDEGESVEEFGKDVQYPFDPSVNPDVAIYGHITSLSMIVQFVTAIDITGNRYLERLDLMGNKLTDGIDLSNSPSLHYLKLSSIPQLSEVDLTNLPLLDTLDVSGTALTSLDVSKNQELVSLACISTDVENINFGEISKVRRLNIWNNRIKELDLSGFPELDYLSLYGNPLTSLDVSKNPKLKTISMGGAEFDGKLDFSNNGDLEELYAYYMNMSDASFLGTLPSPEKLKLLQVNGNAFTSIDIAGFTGLVKLVICKNQLSSSAIDEIVEAMPERDADVTDNEASKIYVIDSGYDGLTEGNEFNNEQLSAMIGKGWWVYDQNSGGDAVRLKEDDLLNSYGK